jgi:hypothetical protein
MDIYHLDQAKLFQDGTGGKSEAMGHMGMHSGEELRGLEELEKEGGKNLWR